MRGGKRKGAGRKPAPYKTTTISVRVRTEWVQPVKEAITNTINKLKTSTMTNTTVTYASASFAGHGHYKITVDLMDENGRTEQFSSTTSHMPDFDRATDLDGQEKYDALYAIIAGTISERVQNWLNEES